MDYKEKYEQALENLKRIKTANKDNKELVEFIEYEYPELKENEDERIRKHLIKHFGNKSKEDWNGVPVKSILAWLEKQGEPLCWIKCSDGLPNRDGTYLVVTDGSHNDVYDMAKYDLIEGWHKASEIIYWMPIPQIKNKSIIEQKPNDKVEPKFKVGDTIVEKDDDECDYETINDIKNGRYIFTDGYCMNIDEQEGWQLVKTPAIIEQKSACQLNNLYGNIKFPFKARVKSSGAIITIHDGQLSMDCKEWINYQSDAEDGHKIYKPDELELVCEVEQNPAWSEEDEKLLNLSFENLTELKDRFGETYGKVGDCIHWLKSLKERMKGE